MYREARTPHVRLDSYAQAAALHFTDRQQRLPLLTPLPRRPPAAALRTVHGRTQRDAHSASPPSGLCIDERKSSSTHSACPCDAATSVARCLTSTPESGTPRFATAPSAYSSSAADPLVAANTMVESTSRTLAPRSPRSSNSLTAHPLRACERRTSHTPRCASAKVYGSRST